jgi:predicted nucleic acid-binding protein
MDLVVNASPLILLCKAGHVRLLEELGDNVFVPCAVVNEVAAYPDDEAGSSVRSFPWINEVDVTVPDSIKAWDLGAGESEVIAYALKKEGARPLLDDAEGKACALAHGLKPLGTAGLLVLAKRSALIESVKPVLFMIRETGLWISDAVIEAIVKSAGE